MHLTARHLFLVLAALLVPGCGGGGPPAPTPTPPPPTFLWSGTGVGNDFAAASDAFPDGSTILAAHVQDVLALERLDLPEGSDVNDLSGSLMLARFATDGQLAWRRTDGMARTLEARDVAALPDGSCVVTGIFTGTVTFGLGDPSATSFTSRGGTDVFVARYTADGVLAWAVRAGGSTVGDASHGLIGDLVSEIGAYGDGSFVIAGEFSSDLGFGEADDRLVLPGGAGGFNTFVARYEGDGSLRWAHEARFTPAAYTHVAARPDGSCLLVGLMPGNAPAPAPPDTELDLRLGAFHLRRSEDGWMYMAAIDAAGTVLWLRAEGRDAQVVPWDIAVDADGSYVVAGEIVGALAGLDGSPALRSDPLEGRHAFLGRFDVMGNAIWARKDDAVAHNQVALRRGGAPVVVGSFLDQAQLDTTILECEAGWGSYLARFDADGRLEAVRQEGGTGLGLFTYPGDVNVLRDGRIAFSGNFQGEVLVGQGSVDPIGFTSQGSWDLYFVMYGADTELDAVP